MKILVQDYNQHPYTAQYLDVLMFVAFRKTYRDRKERAAQGYAAIVEHLCDGEKETLLVPFENRHFYEDAWKDGMFVEHLLKALPQLPENTALVSGFTKYMPVDADEKILKLLEAHNIATAEWDEGNSDRDEWSYMTEEELLEYPGESKRTFRTDTDAHEEFEDGMEYVSIDLETTGLDNKENQILEFGAVIERCGKNIPLGELPKFHTFIDNDGELTGSEFAMNMNAKIIEKIENKTPGYDYTKPEDLGKKFFDFLRENGLEPKNGKIEINVAGKNFGMFDDNFLTECPGFKNHIEVFRRIIDPAMLCVDWKKDKKLPSLNECMERKGIEGEVTHNAVEDALDVIKVLRKSY